MHTEQDRIAHNNWLNEQDLEMRTTQWLQDNPSVGVLNSGSGKAETAHKFYIIRNEQMIEITRFATLTN